MIVLINHVPNHSYTFSFHSKNIINLLKIRKKSEKIRKKSRKLDKVLEEGSIAYYRLLEERGVVDCRQCYWKLLEEGSIADWKILEERSIADCKQYYWQLLEEGSIANLL